MSFLGSMRLNPDLLEVTSTKRVDEILLPFFRSTDYKIDRESAQLYLLGPNTSYHDIDPKLELGLADIDAPIDRDARQRFQTDLGWAKLCLEDSFCAFDILEHIAKLPTGSPLTIIHLDDHTDMMSTLIGYNGGLFDIFAGRTFDPQDLKDWHEAISSGVIGIGSFLTPFFTLQRPVRLYHLQSNVGTSLDCLVSPIGVTHGLFVEQKFLSVKVSANDIKTNNLKTYSRSSDPEVLLKNIKCGPILVHIDLDYFINDFNGNLGQKPLASDLDLQRNAIKLMDDFFSKMTSFAGQNINWSIGVSPGFCGAQHWLFLLRSLEERVSNLREWRN